MTDSFYTSGLFILWRKEKRKNKTIRGNEWGTNNVYSVLKRNKERLERLEIRKQETEIEYGKMELVWLREGELYFDPRSLGASRPPSKLTGVS